MRKRTCLALLTVLAAGSLSGCSYSAHETRAAFEPVTDSTAAAKPLAVLPSESGNVVAVLESRLAGVYTQRIVLSGDSSTAGENAVTVQIDQSDRHPADLGSIPRPTQDGIARELDSAFPTIDMQISRAWGHNDFGPFGYAVGKASASVTCIYAWQFAQGAMLKLVGDPRVISASESMPSAPTSIRVRLCRQGLSEPELVSLVRALEVYPPIGGPAYHDSLYAGVGPDSGGDALQAAGAPATFYAHPHAAPAVVGPRRAPHRQSAHRQAARYRAPQSQAMVSVAPRAGGVMVPLPSTPSVSPGPASSSASAVNPLLAPLQAAPPPRPVSGASDDMPLPGAPAQTQSAPAPTHSSSAMPLPN